MSENFFPPSKKENSCQKYATYENSWQVLFFFVWDSFFPLPLQLLRPPWTFPRQLKTWDSCHRWQIRTFHLSAVSWRSESSVCLSKTFSVFNLKCVSGSLSVARPAAPAPSRPGWDPKDVRGFDEGRVHRDPALTAAFKHFWVIKRTWGLRGDGCFRQISHLWIRSFLTTILKRRRGGRWHIESLVGVPLCHTEHFFVPRSQNCLGLLWVFEAPLSKLSLTCLSFFISARWMPCGSCCDFNVSSSWRLSLGFLRLLAVHPTPC